MTRDRGSATVWSMGLMAVLVAVFAAVALMSQAVVSRHRAAAAADLAALAAADHALDGEEAACGLAERVAAAQGAALGGCEVVGEVSDVVAEVGGARVRSRAGPALADEQAPGPPGAGAGPVADQAGGVALRTGVGALRTAVGGRYAVQPGGGTPLGGSRAVPGGGTEEGGPHAGGP